MSLLRGIAAAIALLAALPGSAAGHAVLLESSPAADAVLERAPQEIRLRFNEPVRLIGVQILLAEDRRTVEPTELRAADTVVRARLGTAAPDGTYVVSYRVTSADGHPASGSLIFRAGKTLAMVAGVRPEVDRFDRSWEVAGVAARAFWHGARLLAAGLALFLALLAVPAALEPTLRRALRWLALVGLAAGLVMLGVAGGSLHGGSAGILLGGASWRLALGSPVAASVALAAGGLGLLLFATLPDGRMVRGLRLTGALLVGLSFGISGHAATAGPRWLTAPVLALHAIAAAYWVGAFAPLLLALRRLPRAQAHALLAGFSRRAIWAVAGLLLAGVVLSALQLRTPSALITTDYGRLLLAKLTLVALLLGLGALNRLVLTPALARGAQAASRLKRTIGADLALAAAIVLLTAGLGTVPPPRALALQEAARHGRVEAPSEFATHATVRGSNLILVATPAAVGANRIDLYATDPGGQPLNAKEAELVVGLPERSIAPLRFPALPVEPGHFRVAASLPVAGTWQGSVNLLIDDFTKLGFRTRIVIRP